MKKKLLYLVTEDWYFCSHRMALAKAAQKEGYDITVVTRVRNDADRITRQGFTLLPVEMDRGGVNPLRELMTLFKIWKILYQEKPDIVHNIALKPVIYGGLAAYFCPRFKSVNLVAGLGAVFSSQKLKSRLVRPWVRILLKQIFQQSFCRIIVQNSEDLDVLVRQFKLDQRQVALIRGSGVDIHHYRLSPDPAGKIRVALVSRMLWDKGVAEYVQAVDQLKKEGLDFDAVLVGIPDPENPASITRDQLDLWDREGVIEWSGYIDNIADIWRNTHIAVLPSYREGLPKCLLEAAASGRAIVTTDTSGCKEIVKEGVNGFLVPVQDVRILAEKMKQLIQNQKLRMKMGAEGRKMVEKAFSIERVNAETLQIYREVM